MPEGSAPSREGECAFCTRAITAAELDDPDATYREVRSWVTGPKSQSPVLREQTGYIAHVSCVMNQVAGQAADQETLPGL